MISAVRENGSAVLAAFEYDDLGRRTKLTRGNGVVTNYGYNNSSLLSSLGLDLPGSGNDQSKTYSYNPAMQIAQSSFTNDAYNWNGHYAVNRSYTANPLNQYSAVGSLIPTYDARGNLTSAGTTVYTYNSKNQLIQASDTGKQFYFDPSGRLDSILSSTGSPLIGFQYDGPNIATEVNPAAANAVTRRYVWGPGVDEALVWYEGSGTTDRRYLVADERGSVVAVTDSSGNALAINSYDEFGIPASTNLGRFQYTGQAWLPELGMYHFKARTYSPTLGRFLQTDPIGYGDGINWYNYGGADPINNTDPSGLQTGTNITGDIHCPSCFATGVPTVTGEKGDREKGDRAQSPTGLAGTYSRWVARDSLGNILWTTQWTFKSDGLFSIPNAGGFTNSAPAEEGDITITGFRRASVQYRYMDGLTLWNHFVGGSGETICLTRAQFGEIVRNAQPSGPLVRGGTYSQRPVHFYGTHLGKVYGGGMMYYDRSGTAVGFQDVYDFDWADRSLGPEVATRFGSLGYLMGGKDFNYGYPCQ